MSMTEVIQEMSGRDFSEFMNVPTWNGEAETKRFNDGLWVICPFCQKKEGWIDGSDKQKTVWKQWSEEYK